MRLLFILAHPVPESLSASPCTAAIDAARAKGHETRVIDLCALGFDPVMKSEELRHFADAGAPHPT